MFADVKYQVTGVTVTMTMPEAKLLFSGIDGLLTAQSDPLSVALRPLYSALASALRDLS